MKYKECVKVDNNLSRVKMFDKEREKGRKRGGRKREGGGGARSEGKDGKKIYRQEEKSKEHGDGRVSERTREGEREKE